MGDKELHGNNNEYYNATETKPCCSYHIIEYIVLENLVGKFDCPCILDLKIGTRSYTDVMSPRKQQEHLERAATTTTGTLGIRFCGMQVSIHNRLS